MCSAQSYKLQVTVASLFILCISCVFFLIAVDLVASKCAMRLRMTDWNDPFPKGPVMYGVGR